ncbi:DNA ligase [Coprinopsis cinerea okayama7|uniref:DNA ligase n=1 Tax=Coprinopsis cinerea (strain Okayama-7 / 130 / ATCC MYA-4618 / FGSC 9003) TaxID=240176 RepID=A8P6S5_COPC7|nr:DNA ligase [Coprinopsis cinerea okayama7\|eukprot:XP_001839218.2 DNA ligase [Coprinopsis cinerea okayama7\
MADELAEINGIAPNVILEEGEEKEVGSSSRFVKGQPVNARTCKHLKSLLGDDYEAARLELKGGSSPPVKTSKAKPAPKAKTAAKRKKPADEDEEGEEEEEKPAKRGRKAPASGSKSKPASKAKPSSRRGKPVDEDEQDDDEEEEEEERPAKRARKAPTSKVSSKPPSKTTKVEPEEANDDDVMVVDSNEELAEIDGIKPKVILADGEVKEVKSATSKSVYKVKRSFDHFHCSCPAWRNQKGAQVNARTCKHLQSLLGEEYEAARLQLKGGQKSSASKPPSKKPASKRSVKADSEAEKPASKTKQAPASKGSARVKKELEEVKEEDKEAEGDGDEEMASVNDENEAPDGDDELAVINGIKPKVYLKDGEQTEVKSASSNSMYKVKRTWDHYYWSLADIPSFQGGCPVNARTCKHLQGLLGADYEAARLKWKNPDGPAPRTAAAKGKGKGKSDAPSSSTKSVPDLLLANKWDFETGIDPTGWWISEKLDGVRVLISAFWDGKQFFSRLGNPFTPPKWFLETLPKDVKLDGELFGGRQQFQSTVSVVKTVNSPHWKGISFQVFDIPSKASDPFEKRLETLDALFGEGGSHKCSHVSIVEHVLAKSRDHVLEKLKEIEELGGEGLMLRKPQSKYEGSRSNTLLKVKTFYDAEAVVTGYEPGKGRNAGVTGALKCKMASGKTFNVGTGLSDKQRKNPPKIGSIIVYRFQELTRDKVPRFPSFIGEAADKTEPKDADIPPSRIAGASGADA